MDIKALLQKVNQICKEIIKIIYVSKTGHAGGDLPTVDIHAGIMDAAPRLLGYSGKSGEDLPGSGELS
jgi:transketolase N-terminal domain/subunit